MNNSYRIGWENEDGSTGAADALEYSLEPGGLLTYMQTDKDLNPVGQVFIRGVREVWPVRISGRL